MSFATIRRLFAGMLALVLLAGLVLIAPGTRPAAAQTGDIVLAFEGKVRSGPSKNTELAGILTLTPGADGSLTGGLDLGNGTVVPVEGTIGAGNVSVKFTISDTAIVFGIGTPNRQGGFSGPFVGPAAGDQGRWTSAPLTTINLDFSGTVERGANAGVTLAGPLTITANPLDDDKFTGALTVEGIGEFPVTGELNDDNTSIDITFDASVLAPGLTIEGEGELEDGAFEGPFKGPAPNDRGSWTATITQ